MGRGRKERHQAATEGALHVPPQGSAQECWGTPDHTTRRVRISSTATRLSCFLYTVSRPPLLGYRGRSGRRPASRNPLTCSRPWREPLVASPAISSLTSLARGVEWNSYPAARCEETEVLLPSAQRQRRAGRIRVRGWWERATFEPLTSRSCKRTARGARSGRRRGESSRTRELPHVRGGRRENASFAASLGLSAPSPHQSTVSLALEVTGGQPRRARLPERVGPARVCARERDLRVPDRGASPRRDFAANINGPPRRRPGKYPPPRRSQEILPVCPNHDGGAPVEAARGAVPETSWRNGALAAEASWCSALCVARPSGSMPGAP